jgi:hypothetical protein
MFPVRYKLNSYISFKRDSVFKGLNATRLCNLNYYYEVVCFLYNFHKIEETLPSFNNLEKTMVHRVQHRTRIGRNTNGAPSGWERVN